MPDDEDERAPAKRKPAGFGATMRAVFWSFFGVRKRSDYDRDATSLRPAYVIAGALVGVVVFIGLLVIAVQVAVRHA